MKPSRFRSLGANKTYSSPVTPTFDPVVPNLAVTPTQMAQMTASGIPVSTQNIGQVEYSEVTSLQQSNPLGKRGMDRVSLWNLSEDSKQRILKGHKADINLYDRVHRKTT